MADVITSAYDGQQITVDELMADPTYIPQRVIEDLDNAFVEDLFFRDGGSNQGVVAFREAAAHYLADDAEEIAEYGEIPVSAPELGALRAAFGIKTGEAIRVSWEQRNENKVDAVTRAIDELEKTVLRHGINAVFSAFNAASIPELQAGSQWVGGDPVKDIFDAIEQVQGAHVEGDETRVFDYDPNTILLHPQSLTKLLRNEQIQKYYIGDKASDNPVFKGLKEIELFGTLQVATSRLMPKNEVYVFEQGAAGFKSDTMPLTATPMYSEGGDSPIGGPTMSWRSDLVRKRAIAVDNPLSVVKITGV
ncbi:phage major capsid protein [Corynebacterium kalidii]